MDDLKTLTVQKVEEKEDGYNIYCSESIGFGLHKKYFAVPNVGDTVTLHCIEGSRQIRGLDINGDRIFYLSDEEARAEREEMTKQIAGQDKDSEIKLKADFEALPEIFQKRINRFKKNNPLFGLELELLEIFCCREAYKMIKGFKSEKERNSFRTFYKIFSEHVEIRVVSKMEPFFNATLKCTLALVNDYLEDPERILHSDGALAEIVGSEAYGKIDID